MKDSDFYTELSQTMKGIILERMSVVLTKLENDDFGDETFYDMCSLIGALSMLTSLIIDATPSLVLNKLSLVMLETEGVAIENWTEIVARMAEQN